MIKSATWKKKIQTNLAKLNKTRRDLCLIAKDVLMRMRFVKRLWKKMNSKKIYWKEKDNNYNLK